MKKSIGFLIATILVTTAVQAQTVIDTSLLKIGNTWLYDRHEENRSASILQSGYSGTIRLTIDSLFLVSDTVKFRVVRRDSGQQLVWEVGTNPTTISTLSTTYAFHAGTYSPSTPLFATRQSFGPNSSPKVEYRGDTLRYSHLTTGGGCMSAAIINLESVGLVDSSRTWGGCGTTSGVDRYRLLSLNGYAYYQDSVHTVSLWIRPVKRTAPAHPLRLERFRLSVEHRGGTFNLMGQKNFVDHQFPKVGLEDR